MRSWMARKRTTVHPHIRPGNNHLQPINPASPRSRLEQKPVLNRLQRVITFHLPRLLTTKLRVRLLLLAASTLALAIAASPLHGQSAPAVAHATTSAAVTVTDNGGSWTLDNGIVKATVTKNNAFMPSFIFQGKQMLAASGGTWEHTPQGAPQLTNTVTIDPATNNGDRAEIAVKGITGGTYMLTRNAPGGGSLCDMEIRYSLGRGDSGIYIYAIWNHPASYPAAGTGAEDRYITRLNQEFDWITVDKDRNMLEAAPKDWGTGVVVHAKEQRIMNTGVYKNSVEHKYSYSGSGYRNPAYGWSSTKNHVGMWFINPTAEYLAGGPDRIDLDAHFGDNGDPEPIILDYWHSGHYAGARTNIAAGEQWTKVIGPIFIYANSLATATPTTPAELATLAATAGNPTVPASWTANANALWQDALAQARKENGKWPYAWVTSPDYTPARPARHRHRPDRPRRSPRPQRHLQEAPAPHRRPRCIPTRHPPRQPDGVRVGNSGFAGMFTGPGSWVHDARYYTFFNDGTEDGKFTITKVRPGTYTLHATADGVLGDFAHADITVEPARPSTSASSHGSPSATAASFGRSATRTAPPTSSSKATARTTGSGAGISATPCSSPTTSPTPSARATRARTGSSKKCPTPPTSPS